MSVPTNNEERLSCICKGAVHAIVATDENDRIVTMNPAAERLRGIKTDMVLGKPIFEVFALLDPDTREQLECPTVRSFEQDPSPRTFQRALLPSGTKKETIVTAVTWPNFDGNGKLIGLATIMHDIRDIVTDERAILDRQKVEAIGSMAANIAQDFNAWIGVVSGHASAAMESLIPNTRAHEAALRILASTNQARSMIDRLMAVASAASLDLSDAIESVSAALIVNDAINLAKATFMRSNIICKTVKQRSMPYVMANPTQLLTCLMNLLRNAVEAMPEGGTITIDTAERVVAEHTYIVLRVRDSGEGIGRADLRRMFDPFFSTKSVTNGATGLGLTVVQSLVESWGGFVKVRSHFGHGSSFRLFLAKSDEEHPDIEPVEQTGGTVLVVDDNQAILDEVRSILKDAGYTALLASNAKECLALYRTHVATVDAVIIDAVMPGENVDELLDELLRLNSAASVVMTSGFSRDYVRDRIERGAWHFLQKPFEPEQLLASVNRILDPKNNGPVSRGSTSA